VVLLSWHIIVKWVTDSPCCVLCNALSYPYYGPMPCGHFLDRVVREAKVLHADKRKSWAKQTKCELAWFRRTAKWSVFIRYVNETRISNRYKAHDLHKYSICKLFLTLFSRLGTSDCRYCVGGSKAAENKLLSVIRLTSILLFHIIYNVASSGAFGKGTTPQDGRS
jgi:predicted ATPase